MAEEAELIAAARRAEAEGRTDDFNRLVGMIKAGRSGQAEPTGLDPSATTLAPRLSHPVAKVEQGMHQGVRLLGSGATFGALPSAAAAIEASMPWLAGPYNKVFGGGQPTSNATNWSDRYAENKARYLAAQARSRSDQGYLGRVPEAFGTAGTAILGGGALAPLSRAAAGASLPVRAAAGLGDATALSTALGAVGATGTDKSVMSGAVEGATSPWNLLGAAIPLAGGLASSAPRYFQRARQAASEILRPGVGTTRALQSEFGTGAGTGNLNAGQALLDMRMPNGEPLIVKGDTTATIADKMKYLHEWYGQQKGEFTKSLDPYVKVDAQAVAEDADAIRQQFSGSRAHQTNPAFKGFMSRLNQWLDNVKANYGLKIEGVSGPGVASKKGPAEARAPDLQPGAQPTEAGFNHMGDIVQNPTVGAPPMVGSPGGVSRVKNPNQTGITRPAENTGWKPVMRELPLSEYEALKSSLDDVITNYSSKFPNPEAVAKTDPLMAALYRLRGKINARAEEAVGRVSPEALDQFRTLKEGFGKTRPLDTALEEASNTEAAANAAPRGSALKRALETAVRVKFLSHGAAREARGIGEFVPEPTSPNTALRNKKIAETLLNMHGGGDAGAGTTAAAIQLLRSH